MFFRNYYEQPEYRAALPYKANDFGLFEAISDENILAIKGLIQFFEHRVNCVVTGGGYNKMSYTAYPTPLSFALSRPEVNVDVVKLLIDLGADIKDKNAIPLAEQSEVKEIRNLFNLPDNDYARGEEFLNSHKSKNSLRP